MLGIPILELLLNPIIMLLLLISAVSLAAMLDRMFFLGRMRFNYDAFLGKMRAFLSQRDVEGATKYSDTFRHPFARICRAGLLHSSLDRAALYNVIDNTIDQEKSNLESHIGTLSTIAFISPLLGLLGTVIGIIQAFAAMAMAGGGSPTEMMSGIAIALLTTAIGIVIAVPAAIMFGVFSGKVDSIEEHLFSGSRDLVLILSEENIMDKRPVKVKRAKWKEEKAEEASAAAGEALTPGINMAMLLILFFMMFAPMMYQSNITVSTPALAKAPTERKEEKKTELKLTLYVAEDGTVFINDEPYGNISNPDDRVRQDEVMHQLLLRSTMRMALISGHSTVFHRDVVDIIDRARQAGAVKIALLKRREK